MSYRQQNIDPPTIISVTSYQSIHCLEVAENNSYVPVFNNNMYMNISYSSFLRENDMIKYHRMKLYHNRCRETVSMSFV